MRYVPTSIRYPVAYQDDQLVFATNVIRAEYRKGTMTCVGCEGVVAFRGGTAKTRPHFAHLGGVCSQGETALHQLTIKLVSEAIERASVEGQPYRALGKCPECHDSVSYDLSTSAPGATCVLDRALAEQIRPDICVRDASGTPVFIVEVVVTHAPETAALACYRRLGLPVIVLTPTWDDLANYHLGLEQYYNSWGPHKGTVLEVIDRCTKVLRSALEDPGHRPCSTCGKDSVAANLELSLSSCYKCHKEVRVLDTYVFLKGQTTLLAPGCTDLVGVEAPAAGLLEVRLEPRMSKAAGWRYLMVICPSCGAQQGDNFLYLALGGEKITTPPEAPVYWMQVCQDGHWESLDIVVWPQDTDAVRGKNVTGVLGDAAGLFEPLSTRPPAELLAFESMSTPRQAVEALFGGIGRMY